MKNGRRTNHWPLIALFSLSAVLSKSAYSVDCDPPVSTGPLTKQAKQLLKDLKKAVPPPTTPVLAHRFYVSPDEVRRYDSRTLATLLVEKVHNECDLSANPLPDAKPVSDDSELIMMVPSRVLSSIAARGFHNQHETASTGGCACTENRFNTEQEMIMTELPYSDKGRELLPKYSSFNVKRSDFGTFGLPTQYGDAAIIFKPEVKARSTWTFADSLNDMTGHSETGQPGFTNGNLTRTDQYKRDKNDKNTCGNGYSYCEAQIWGGLDMTDVDSLLVTNASAVTDSMKAIGVPIYQLLYTSPTPSAGQYSKGPLLYSPPSGTQAKTPKALNESELDSIINPSPGTSPAPSTVDQNIAEGDVLAFATDAKLNNPESVASYLTTTTSGGWGSNLDAPRRALAELAARPKTPESIATLEQVFDKGTPLSKALALYGLSEAPWSEVKPRVITALTGTDQPLALLGIAIAADHQNDKDIKNALKKTSENFKSAPGGYGGFGMGYGGAGVATPGAPPVIVRNTVQEHLDRLTKKHFCDPVPPGVTSTLTTAPGATPHHSHFHF
jgi:hypothetical protein